MLIGYVSDERYVAIPEVLLEFEGEGVFTFEPVGYGQVPESVAETIRADDARRDREAGRNGSG